MKVIALAGLLTCGSQRGSNLPKPGMQVQWHILIALSAYSCGGSRGIDPIVGRTAFPIVTDLKPANQSKARLGRI